MQIAINSTFIRPTKIDSELGKIIAMQIPQLKKTGVGINGDLARPITITMPPSSDMIFNNNNNDNNNNNNHNNNI